jgi:hypothetical protein
MREYSPLFELNPNRPDSVRVIINQTNVKKAYTRISTWQVIIRNCGILFHSKTVAGKILLSLAVVSIKNINSNVDESRNYIRVARAGI